ncbi:MAG: TonB-dependent receptor [Myxococcales bacterium]|nr:TonB-dependent receptor [Myxococcales bacterium]
MKNLRTSPPSIRTSALSIALGLLVLLGSEPAAADVRTEARAAFREGMRLIEAGQLESGIRSLERAFDILPHPNVLYNIGRAYAEAGHYEEGLEYYEMYLESDPPDREEAQAFVVALRDRIAAQREAAIAAAAEPEAPAEPEPPAEPEVPSVSSEEILAIEESADQITALAEATQSDALRERAQRLRLLAQNLRERGAAAEAAAQAAAAQAAAGAETGAGGGAETGTGSGAETGAGSGPEIGAGTPGLDEGLALGEQRGGDIYEETVVSASRMAESPLDAPNSTTIVTAQDIRLSGITHIGELLRRAGGLEVMSLSPADTAVAIRGLNQRQPNKVLVLINGRSQRMDFLGSPFWAALPITVEDIERIEIIRGPASAIYGADAFSGIVNIITREPGDGTSFVTLSAGNDQTIRAAAAVRGRSDRLSYRVSGGYEQANQFALETDTDRQDLDLVSQTPQLGLDRRYVSADTRYSFGEGNAVRAGIGLNQGNYAVYAISRLRQLHLEGSTFVQAYAGVETNSGLSFRTFWNHLAMTFETNEVPVGAFTYPGILDQNVIDMELSFARTFRLVVDHSFSSGLNYRFKTVDFSWMDDSHTEHHFGGYVQDILKLHDRLRLALSLRADQHPLLEGLRFSPRGSLVYRFVDGQSARFTAGTAFRSPSFVESYLFIPNRTPIRGATAFGVGSQTLDPERMVSLEIGYSNQATDFFALEANLYYNLVDDLILLSEVDTFSLGDFADGAGHARYRDDLQAFPIGDLVFANDRTQFRQLGGELGLRIFPLTGLDLYANYSLHDTSPLGQGTLDQARLDEQRTSRHKINVGVQYRSSFGLDLSADFHWVSSQLWAMQVTDVETGVRFDSFALPSYSLLNARVGYRLFDDQVELGIVGSNLLFQARRQHPYAQPVATRIMGTGTLRF